MAEWPRRGSLRPRVRGGKGHRNREPETRGIRGDFEPVIFARAARNATLPGSRHPLTIRPERRRRRSRSRMGAAGDAALGSESRELMSAADVGRTISRIAHQIIEKTALDSLDAPTVVLLGIPTRGVILAERLATHIGEYSGVEVGHGALDITLYRDDLMQKPPRPLEATSIPAGGIDDVLVILVDDVLYSGRSVRSALDALRDVGRPRVVQLAVLVDRGHRELPLRADYVGKNVPTSRGESVHVLLSETDGDDGVVISR